MSRAKLGGRTKATQGDQGVLPRYRSMATWTPRELRSNGKKGKKGKK
jgi:hypothetical protein